ncbi:unnamed protein product, partial [Prorocentrum cordatum]
DEAADEQTDKARKKEQQKETQQIVRNAQSSIALYSQACTQVNTMIEVVQKGEDKKWAWAKDDEFFQKMKEQLAVVENLAGPMTFLKTCVMYDLAQVKGMYDESTYVSCLGKIPEKVNKPVAKLKALQLRVQQLYDLKNAKVELSESD